MKSKVIGVFFLCAAAVGVSSCSQQITSGASATEQPVVNTGNTGSSNLQTLPDVKTTSADNKVINPKSTTVTNTNPNKKTTSFEGQSNQ